MQRVRIGLTGLAFVFVVVLLAAILTGQRQEDVPVAASVTAAGEAEQNAEGTTQPSEPLAELGVAPGAADSGGNAASPTNSSGRR